MPRSFDNPKIEISPQTSALFRQALDLYKQRADKAWSLTDCASFWIMQQKNILEALTHDRHFEQAGFIALLRLIEASPSKSHRSTCDRKTLPSDRETSTSELEPPTSEHESCTSEHGTPASKLEPPTSEHGTSASKLGTSSLEHGTPTFELHASGSEVNTPCNLSKSTR